MDPFFTVVVIVIVTTLVVMSVFRENEHFEQNVEEQKRERERIKFIDAHKGMSTEEIVLSKSLDSNDKLLLLREGHGYERAEANELLNAAWKAEQKAKLRGIKRKIAQKAEEMHGDIPVHDRSPISDDVKSNVWRRDQGKCIKCGGNEKLEFDHIIPFSKGGSNTERNLQLLCEKCNRSKSDYI